jgi:SPP1 family predicted phage head-tail adaptor
MRAGELRELIVIERRGASAPDALGEATPTWQTFARAWARIGPFGPSRGREFQAPGQETAERRTVLRTRAIDGVTSAMRVRMRGRLLDIVSVEPDARGWMDLYCREAE